MRSRVCTPRSLGRSPFVWLSESMWALPARRRTWARTSRHCAPGPRPGARKVPDDCAWSRPWARYGSRTFIGGTALSRMYCISCRRDLHKYLRASARPIASNTVARACPKRTAARLIECHRRHFGALIRFCRGMGQAWEGGNRATDR